MVADYGHILFSKNQAPTSGHKARSVEDPSNMVTKNKKVD